MRFIHKSPPQYDGKGSSVVFIHYSGNGNASDEDVDDEVVAILECITFFTIDDDSEETRIKVDPEKLLNYAKNISSGSLIAHKTFVGTILEGELPMSLQDASSYRLFDTNTSSGIGDCSRHQSEFYQAFFVDPEKTRENRERVARMNEAEQERLNGHQFPDR